MNTSIIHGDGLDLNFEPPDVIFVNCHGDTTLEDMQKFTAMARTLRSEGIPSTMVLLDMRRSTNMSHEARKELLASLRAGYFEIAIGFGCSFKMRVLFELIARAAKLILTDSCPQELFADEAAARARIAELRQAKRR